jgi:hypothetical protein
MYIKIILLGIGLLVFYRILSFLNKRVAASTKIQHYITVILPVAELLSWLGFAIWCIRLMYESEAYAMLITVSVIIFLLIIPSWFLIRDLVFGIVLVIQSKIELNTRIEIGDISGKIIKIGYFTFDIKSKHGNIDTIPYSKIRSEVITKSGENINLEKQLISFALPATMNIDEAIGKLKITLLNSPWVAASQQPIIKNITRENDAHIVEVFVYLLKKDYIEKIRDYVKINL